MNTTQTTFGTLLTEADYRCIRYAANQPTRMPAAPRLMNKARSLDFKINRHKSFSAAPRGKRSIEDITSLLRAYCERMHEAERMCPNDDEYQVAVQAEIYAKLALQRYQDKHAKDAYEAAKEHRIQIGGAIIHAESIMHRMISLICGELQALGLLNAEVA